MKNRVCQLLGIKMPIIQAGMIWCSGWELAAAVSNSGSLGVIGAGSMYPAVLEEHIKKCRLATKFPFAVNIPLLYPDIEKLMDIVIKEDVKIVFTSAGNPKTWTSTLKNSGIRVIHVVSSLKFARKAQEAGVDAIVAEGFEAGGHNGREETTTFCLIPQISKELDIPVIAAGGVYDGRSMLAAFALGAEAVQIGSRFAASTESSAHINYKKEIIQSGEGDTVLTLKSLTPVRLLRNSFYSKVREAEFMGASPEKLAEILGKRRAKRGIFEGDLEEGELEIGQVSAYINRIQPAGEIVNEIWDEFHHHRNKLAEL